MTFKKIPEEPIGTFWVPFGTIWYVSSIPIFKKYVSYATTINHQNRHAFRAKAKSLASFLALLHCAAMMLILMEK